MSGNSFKTIHMARPKGLNPKTLATDGHGRLWIFLLVPGAAWNASNFEILKNLNSEARPRIYRF